MIKLKQRVLKMLMVGSVILSVSVLSLYLLMSTSVSDYNQTFEIKKLDDSIEIIRDSNAIPHIFATNLGDAYFALGFVHAQDRLWQLELTRAAGNGQLSEIFGADTLSIDKLIRTVDSAKIARLSLERMNDKTKKLFQRYIEGINTHIEQRQGLLPPEFLLFSVKPTKWKLEDTLAIFALVALGADNWKQELQRAAMQQHLSSVQIKTLFPEYPVNGPITHPNSATMNSSPQPKLSVMRNQDKLLTPSLLSGLNELASHPLIASFPASNTWVIDGSRTRSGKPFLASDPHGPIKAPADYYLAHLSGPDFDITGVGYVGMPVFAIGHNRHIAWGLTDIISDMADLYVEKVIPNNSQYYMSAEGMKAFAVREEVIKVKGQEDVELTVRNTLHGPVISDVVIKARDIATLEGEDIVLTLQIATFSEGNISAQAFMGINLAQNWQQFRIAMDDFEMSQNMSYADTEGNIGMLSSAKVPLRDVSDGFMITTSWTKNSENQQYLSSNKMPVSFNPAQGFIANANNKIVSDQYPYFFSREDEMPFRANRIVDSILSSTKHTIDSMKLIQGDDTSQAALTLLPFMLNVVMPNERAEKLVALLSKWDGTMKKNRIEPLVYMVWERELNRLIYADELAGNFNDYFASRPQLISTVISQESVWCDDINTEVKESCDAVITKALLNSIEYLSNNYGNNMHQWLWGEAHQAVFKNDIFTHVPVLNNWSDIRLKTDGGPHTVNVASSDYSAVKPFEQNYGPRYRQIIDMSDYSNSQYMIAPGVSGNFLSPYYDHLSERWANLEYIKIETDRSLLLQQTIGITKLTKVYP